MRKGIKTFLTLATAAVMTAGTFSLAACGSSFKTPSGVPEGDVVSNGGFAVRKGEYVYFINGVESYTSDNTYGTPVRGSLMRIKQADVEAKKNTAEQVIPSLIVGGDYVAGFYIYGDRVYYASPTTVKDTSGVVQTGYLDFMSARLDGTNIKNLHRVNGNSTVYRIVEAGESKTVYIVYLDGSDLYSYNTATGTDTLLASGTTGETLTSSSTQPGWIYYTMAVRDEVDSESGTISYNYNQIYRVRADWTEGSAPGAADEKAPYTYTFDEEYLKDNDVPYENLGELVLDGRGISNNLTQFNHSEEEPVNNPFGYSYTIRSAENGGIYFTRSQLASSSSSADLFYVSEDAIAASSWDSVTGNDKLEEVATAAKTSDASTTALYYKDGDGHHYLYTDGSSIYRADVDAEGKTKDPLEIAHDLSGATLRFIDSADATYKYVYYTCTSGSGVSVERAVYNGDKGFYEDLQFEDRNSKPYQAVKVLDLQHNSAWYPFEVIDGTLYFADASTTVNSTSYNYIATVSLKKDGKLMNNEELADFNEKYDELMDADDGYFAKLNEDGNTKLSAALKYYFYTGETSAFKENIEYAVKEGGKSETYLYSEEEKTAFDDFVKGVGATEGKFKDGETSYRTRAYFVTPIGKMAEEHVEEAKTYWAGTLEHYTAPTVEEEGLPAWAWALIGVGIGIVVLGAAAAVVIVVLRAKKKKEVAPAPDRMEVDTSDSDLDVYAENEPAEEEITEGEPEQTSDSEPEETEGEAVEGNGEAEEAADSEPEAPADDTAAEAPVEDTAEAEAPVEPAPVEEATPEAAESAPETPAEPAEPAAPAAPVEPEAPKDSE